MIKFRGWSGPGNPVPLACPICGTQLEALWQNTHIEGRQWQKAVCPCCGGLFMASYHEAEWPEHVVIADLKITQINPIEDPELEKAGFKTGQVFRPSYCNEDYDGD